MSSLIDPRQGRRRSALRRRNRRWRGLGSVIEYDSLAGLNVLERVMLAEPGSAKDPSRDAPRTAPRHLL
jgi:hypothetical protein